MKPGVLLQDAQCSCLEHVRKIWEGTGRTESWPAQLNMVGGVVPYKQEHWPAPPRICGPKSKLIIGAKRGTIFIMKHHSSVGESGVELRHRSSVGDTLWLLPVNVSSTSNHWVVVTFRIGRAFSIVPDSQKPATDGNTHGKPIASSLFSL